MPTQRDPSLRLREILERNRAASAADLSSDLLEEIAEVEERFQFDDDRKAALQQIRKAVDAAVLSIRLDEEEPPA